MIKFHRPGGLIKRNLFSYNCESWEYETRVQHGQMPGRSLLQISVHFLYPHMIERARSNYMAINPILKSPFKFNHLLKLYITNTVIFEARSSTCEF